MSCTIKNVDKNICTGCGVCNNICPADAIKMRPDSEGFLCPEIIENLCVECGLCYNKCPAVNEDIYENYSDPDVYAAYAPDDIRMKSSSGGIFTILAEYIINKGGYAAGVRWNEKFEAVFDIVNIKNDLAPMRGSKYVQSDTKFIYREIKKMLEKKRKVLFVGTPCQAAGLRHFLGKDYNDLYIVDILCHGSPSPKSFNEFLKNIAKSHTGISDISQIKDIEFRNKERHGWGPSILITLKNGMEYDKSRNATSWYTSFLNIMNCRKVCGQCRYNKLPRQGDITLGDFWGIENAMPECDYAKGVSVVTINNKKGQKLFDKISDKLDFVRKSNIDDAKKNNWNLVGSSRSHKYRKDFFELLNMYEDFDKATEYALKRKFDIGYIGWWYGENYGSILTNFALHQYLKSKNKRVLMIEWPLRNKPSGPQPNTMARRLAAKYYDVSIRRTFDELHDLNWFCDSFVVGSDQLWNYWCAKDVDYFYFLDFVDDSKKKISYATSFGHNEFPAADWYLKNTAYHIGRFDHISVREKEGVDICRNLFNVTAVRNIDPVFICDKQEYIDLASQSKMTYDKPYIFAYILNPTIEKKQALLDVSAKTGLDIKIVLDGQYDKESNMAIMNMEKNIVVPEEIEDWLYLIYNSSYVFTDSYHGLCFSIIFKKQFICIANIARGLSRFTTLLEDVQLPERMVFDPKEAIKLTESEIDYNKVYLLLDKEISCSKEWLDNTLISKKTCKASTYDLLMDKIRELDKKITDLKIIIKDGKQ